MNLPPNLLSAFVTVFVTIGPIETAVVFAALTAGVHRPERKSLAARSVRVSFYCYSPWAAARCFHCCACRCRPFGWRAACSYSCRP